jgi:tripartite-type tricarboxylate transporter receptor subunit TctC
MKRIGAIVLGLGLVLGVSAASAQDKYPSKPVKILVPYAPGGATDIVARILG